MQGACQKACPSIFLVLVLIACAFYHRGIKVTFSAWLSLFMISVLGAVSPGPSLAVVIKNTLGGNPLSGIITAWSHALGIGLYALLSLLGLAVVLKKMPVLFLFISYSGAFYLLWIGINAMRSRGGIAARLIQGEKNNYLKCMRDGAMISLLNPKIGLFFIALFSQFIHIDVGFTGKIITVLTPLITDGLWYSIIALTLSRPKILAFLRARAKLLDRLTGVVLIALALRIFWIGALDFIA